MHGIVFHWCETMELKDVKILTTTIKKAFNVYLTPSLKKKIKTSMDIPLLLCGFLVLKCMVVFETRVRQGYENMHYQDYKWKVLVQVRKVKRLFLFLLAFISRSCTKATTQIDSKLVDQCLFLDPTCMKNLLQGSFKTFDKKFDDPKLM